MPEGISRKYGEYSRAELDRVIEIHDPETNELETMRYQEFLQAALTELGAYAVIVSMNGELSDEAKAQNSAITRQLGTSRSQDARAKGYMYSVVAKFPPQDATSSD